MSAFTRSIIGADTFDIVIDDGLVMVDGVPSDLDIVEIGKGEFHILAGGKSLSVTAEKLEGNSYRIHIGSSAVDVATFSKREVLLNKYGLEDHSGSHARSLVAPMPGLVLDVMVQAGQEVSKGDGLVLLEAMKMENELKSPGEAVVDQVLVKAGEPVAKGQVLVEFA